MSAVINWRRGKSFNDAVIIIVLKKKNTQVGKFNGLTQILCFG